MPGAKHKIALRGCQRRNQNEKKTEKKKTRNYDAIGRRTTHENGNGNGSTHHQVAHGLAQGTVELPPLDVEGNVVVAVGDLDRRRVVLVEARVVEGVPAELSQTRETPTTTDKNKMKEEHVKQRSGFDSASVEERGWEGGGGGGQGLRV